MTDHKCELCGEPMPAGEESFRYHGFSGPCPKPPLTKPVAVAADRWFHSKDGLFFFRQPDGSVRIVKTDGKLPTEGGAILFEATLDDGSWGSAVLSMSAFGEQPGHWKKWMDHHHGRKDLLS